MAQQEQYSRQECTNIVGLPGNLNVEDLEGAMLNFSEMARVTMETGDFHAVHKLRNTRVIIAKVCNCRDVTVILCNKRKLRKLSQEGKKTQESKNLC